MAGVQKAFGGTHALRGVSLSVGAGEVHALIGENGAGKSTLMNVLSGAIAPDGGTIELDGKPFEPENPQHARRAGIAMIHQELTLARDLNVEQNILLGAEPSRWGWSQAKRCRDVADRALARLGRSDLPLSAPVRELSPADRQVVEIARALTGDPSVIVMDEATSSLGPTDVERLFQVIGQLRSLGVAVVYISHFLEECRRICDRWTVLRDGQTVGSGAMADVSLPELVRLMVGREVATLYPRSERPRGDIVLRVDALRGRRVPNGVSFELHRGEVFGVAGLIGAGRTETLRAIFGLDAVLGGTVDVRGRIGLTSEKRKEEGLLVDRSIADNVTISRFDTVARHGFVSRRRQRDAAQRQIDALGIKAAHPFQAVGELSGGNQQKVALARLLHHDADVLLLDEPTRGIDVGAKAEIYGIVDALARRGKAIVFVSSYLPELLGVADTIGVMHRGRMVAIRPAAEWTEHAVMAAALGQE